MSTFVTCYFRVSGPPAAAQAMGSQLMRRLTDTYGPACGCGIMDPDQVHITVNVPQAAVTHTQFTQWFPASVRPGVTVQCKWVAFTDQFNYGEWSVLGHYYYSTGTSAIDDVVEVEGRKVPHGRFLQFLQEWNLESEYM